MSEIMKKFTQQTMSKIMPDDTKYKQAADELARVNEQLKDLARFPEENPNPVIRVNREGAILYYLLILF